MEIESMKIIYRQEDLLLGLSGEKYYLCIGERLYWLSSDPHEASLYIKGPDRFYITIRHAFTLDELCRAAQTNGSIGMVTGNEYDMRGICMLLRKALDLSKESVDVGYLEGCCFMDYLEECGATSEETAVPLNDSGINNPNVMNPFLHSKKVKRTNDTRFYIVKSHEKGSLAGTGIPDRVSWVISRQVVFGCGYRTVDGKRQYFAWHGYPNRNDDYITTSEISETEYDKINIEYPHEFDADREAAELFRKKYVEGHPIILEGWNKLL